MEQMQRVKHNCTFTRRYLGSAICKRGGASSTSAYSAKARRPDTPCIHRAQKRSIPTSKKRAAQTFPSPSKRMAFIGNSNATPPKPVFGWTVSGPMLYGPRPPPMRCSMRQKSLKFKSCRGMRIFRRPSFMIEGYRGRKTVQFFEYVIEETNPAIRVPHYSRV